jgi:Flp pilus assembly protein TadD
VGLARLLPATATTTRTATSTSGRAAAAAALAVAMVVALGARSVVRTLDWHTAVAFWESELDKAPRDVVVNNNLALAYTAEGRYADAARRLEVAVSANPLYWRAWVNLGIARRWLGQKAGARQAFERAMAVAPRETSPLHFYALFLDAEGDRDVAIALLARARRLRPEDAQLARSLGQVLLRAGRAADARAAFLDAVRLDPKDGESLRALASLR